MDVNGMGALGLAKMTNDKRMNPETSCEMTKGLDSRAHSA